LFCSTDLYPLFFRSQVIHLQRFIMSSLANRQKVIIVGAGPVGALAALYAASRGDEVEIYELRGGKFPFSKNGPYRVKKLCT
jgi:hypothetical protein